MPEEPAAGEGATTLLIGGGITILAAGGMVTAVEA